MYTAYILESYVLQNSRTSSDYTLLTLQQIQCYHNSYYLSFQTCPIQIDNDETYIYNVDASGAMISVIVVMEYPQ